jgi:hypothetical protein
MFKNIPSCSHAQADNIMLLEILYDLFKKHDDQLSSMLCFNNGINSTHVEHQNLTNCQVFHLMFTNVYSTKIILKDLIPPFNLKLK